MLEHRLKRLEEHTDLGDRADYERVLVDAASAGSLPTEVGYESDDRDPKGARITNLARDATVNRLLVYAGDDQRAAADCRRIARKDALGCHLQCVVLSSILRGKYLVSMLPKSANALFIESTICFGEEAIRPVDSHRCLAPPLPRSYGIVYCRVKMLGSVAEPITSALKPRGRSSSQARELTGPSLAPAELGD